MRVLLLIVTLVLVASCAKHEKTDLKLLFESLENERVLRLGEVLKAAEVYLLGAPDRNGVFLLSVSDRKEMAALFEKSRVLGRQGKELSDEDRKRLKYLIDSSKEDGAAMSEMSDSFIKFHAKLFAITSVSFNKCGDNKVEESILKYYKEMPSKYLNYHYVFRNEFSNEYYSYNFDDDCSWLREMKVSMLERLDKLVKMKKERSKNM